MKRAKVKSLPIKWVNTDLVAVVMGQLGRHIRVIADRTGLTNHQVGYRLKRVGVSTRDWRNAKTRLSHEVYQTLGPDMVRDVRRATKALVKK